MTKDLFDWKRFLRVLANDLLLLQPRRVLFTSLGLAGIGFLIYATNLGSMPQDGSSQLAIICFLFLLCGGGWIFTSMSFNDMHHPLERYHYLMLPCSNLERFISRYLVTAPFYIIYTIVLFKVFEIVANFLCELLWDASAPPLELDAGMILTYLGSHVFVFTGAIWFRSYALIKTAVANVVFWSLWGMVGFLALRLIYWDHFISLFEMDPDNPVMINLELGNGEGSPGLWQKLVYTAFLLWLLFLAYLGLREHEVQDGL